MIKLDKKMKIWSILILAVIVVGIIFIATKGFNFDLRYKESQRIQIDLEKNFEISDIKNILDYLGEITGQKYDDELIDRLFKNFCLGK